MKRSLPFWAAVTVAMACDRPAIPTGPLADGPLPFTTDVARQQSPAERTQVIREDEVRTFFDPCFGEEVRVEFHRQIVFFFREDDGGRTHVRFNVINQGSIATGLTTGTVWRLVGTEIEGLQADISTATTPGTLTVVNQLTVVGPGSAPDQRFRERIHITINANEVVTVDRSTFEAVCT